jgi:peptidoglycan glycosyltransferase
VFDFGEQVTTRDGRYYVYEVDGGVIPDPNHQESRLRLPLAYAKSANAAFARMGHEMNPDTFIQYAQRLGFSQADGEEFDLEIDFEPARLANDLDALRSNNLLRAATAIGQGELLANPLSIAMVVQAVVNDGDLSMPHLVQAVRHPNGQLVERLPNRRVTRNLM